MGVPASAEGFVLYASECDGALALGELSLQDDQGRAIPFDVQVLDEGAVLITPESMLPPGSYRVGDMLNDMGDDDGGTPDAGSEPDAGMTEVMSSGEVLEVAPVEPRPTRVGELTRERDACSPSFALELDPAAEAYVSLLALDLQIDQGPLEPFIAYGTLEAVDGRASLTVPEELWRGLYDGPHQLTIVARIAGDDVPLESISMQLDVACDPLYEEESEPGFVCSVASTPGARSSIALSSLIALGACLFVRRRRRRSH